MNDMLGVAASACTPARGIRHQSGEYQKSKERVGHGEDPRRGLVEDEPLDPVLNEALLVASVAGLNAKLGLEGCEMTLLPQPSLSDNKTDGRQVKQAKGEGVDPTPDTSDVADKDTHQAADDEQDDAEVKNEDGICKEAIRHVGGLRRLT